MSFLEFYFTSPIVDVRRRAGAFMAYRPTVQVKFAPARIYQIWHTQFPAARSYLHEMIVEDCAHKMVLQESDNIINDPAFSIRTSKLTIAGIRDLLRPSAIAAKYRAHAPFMWRLLTTFSASPNEYRKKKKLTNNVVGLDSSDSDHFSGGDESESDPTSAQVQDERVPKKPQGFSRNPFFVVTATIAMLTFVRNRATNALPLLIGLFLKVSGAPSRVIRMLSNIGLSVSESTIERLKEVLSNDAIKIAIDFITSGRLFYIIFDNINIYLKKFQQQLTNLNQMIHATNVAVVGVDEEGVDQEEALDMETYLSLRGKRSEAKFNDICPTPEDNEHIQKAFAGLVGRLIIQHCPGSENWKERQKMKEEIEKMIPQDRPLSPRKTTLLPFGVVDVNEGSKHGIVKVLEKIRERTTVPVEEWVSKVRIFEGDWLTSSNFRGARRDRTDDVNAMERLEYGFPISALWHYALQATFMIMRTHYGHSTVEDPTCLRAHKELLRRTWDVNKPNYAAAKALIRHSLIARILHILISYRKLRRWSGLTNWHPTIDEVKATAVKIVSEYTTTAAAETAKGAGDDVLAHNIYFLRDALMFLEFEDAICTADAGRVLRVLKYWCFAFRGAGQHNYARECAEVLLQWRYETTASLRQVLERSWFVNRWGLARRWIPSDLFVEQMNYFTKCVLIAHGNGVTVGYIQRKGSACIEAFREIVHLVANFFGDPDRSRRSKEIAFRKDLEALVDEMINRKVLESKERHVYAPPPKPRANANTSTSQKKSKPPVRKSAIVDVQAVGGAVWNSGKFSEFIASSTFDPALKSYPLSDNTTRSLNPDSMESGDPELAETDTVFDSIENPLVHDSYEDLHGEDRGSGMALGGGDEYWTGNPVDST
ncbi:hypothetical protein AAF712_004037 [Marasmius tenuissimus]|uniref:DUF6589 domain-containing protein n=1 Tax=Marasmius tenuissimus TaxID=585030 RepID=A0ABR3A543_9AGAR